MIINYAISSTIVLGGAVGYFISSTLDNIVPYLLPIAAGGFIYIAASDLIPEIRKETGLKKSINSFAIFILGITLMLALKLIID